MQTATLFTDVTCLWVFENYYDNWHAKSNTFLKVLRHANSIFIIITDPTFLWISPQSRLVCNTNRPRAE